MRIGFVVLLCVTLLSTSAVANDCACPTVQANGKGSTSCSASESNGRCTIDYNLFSPAAEQLAGQLLTAGGLPQIRIPSPGINTIQNLLELSQRGGPPLVDAVLVYLMVATADRIIDGTGGNATDSAVRDIVVIVTPFRDRIETAFNGENMTQWLGTPNEQIPANPAQFGLFTSLADNRLILAPGCIEVRSGNLWVMFKASWSAMRLKPRCGGG
jgi:hypothetical protein